LKNRGKDKKIQQKLLAWRFFSLFLKKLKKEQRCKFVLPNLSLTQNLPF